MHSRMTPRIPEQQSVGQTLPPKPVGVETDHSVPLPMGAMPIGTHLQVDKYQVYIHNFIAEGGYAHVYLARIEGKQGFVVLKKLTVPDKETLQMVEKEIAFMSRLRGHKNIVHYYASRIDPQPSGGFEAYILMEYCPGGGVIDLMNRRLQQRLTEPEILKIFCDVCEALAFMHYCNPPVLHRDLKIENILILSQDHYKLADFGSAALSKGLYVPTTIQELQKLEDDIQRSTTLQYRSPEMVDIYQKKPINEKSDIWALGVLLYKLCYYTTPFEEQGQLAILNARYTFPVQPVFSDGLKRLIAEMLQEDQNKRPNIYQVLKSTCGLRGLPCPIRDIYSEQVAKEPPRVQSAPVQTQNSTTIFEKVYQQQQMLPEITPMRRGRPTRHVKADSQPQSDSGTHAPREDTPNSTKSDRLSSYFEPQTVKSNPQRKRTSSVGRNEPSPQSLLNKPSIPKSSPAPLTPAVSREIKRFEELARLSLIGQPTDLSGDSDSSDDAFKPRPKSVNVVQAPLPVKPLRSVSSAQRNRPATAVSSTKTTSIPLSATPSPSAPPPSHEKTVVKGEVKATPSQPVKPAPPPKPARFRVAKQSSSSAQTPSPPAPSLDNRHESKEIRRPPSITDFEKKFPSIEELY